MRGEPTGEADCSLRVAGAGVLGLGPVCSSLSASLPSPKGTCRVWVLCDTDCQRGLHNHPYVVSCSSPYDVVACCEHGNTGMQCYEDAIALM